MKNEKTKLIIWAVIALVIGVIIGMIITNITTGNAKAILNQNTNNITKSELTEYEKYAFNEIDQYIIKNNLSASNILVYRKSTQGNLTPSQNIQYYDLTKYNYQITSDGIILTNKETNETNTIYAKKCDTSVTHAPVPSGGSILVPIHYTTWEINGETVGEWKVK